MANASNGPSDADVAQLCDIANVDREQALILLKVRQISNLQPSSRAFNAQTMLTLKDRNGLAGKMPSHTILKILWDLSSLK